MALDRAVLPVDRLVAGYNLLLAAVWSVTLLRTPYAPWICAAHLAAAGLPSLLEQAKDRLTPAGRALREIYPLLLLVAFWSELGFIREQLHAGANDAPIAALDLALFGVHVNAVWMPRMPHVWLSEVMHFVYFAYYPLIFLPPLVMGLAGRTAALRDMTLRLLVTYIGCYLIYIFFPVDGPSHTMVRYAGALTDGFFYRLAHGAVHVGDSLGTAFPSSHVAGAVTIAYLGWRWCRPAVAALLAVEAAGVCLATIYTQNHFTIDSVAGVVLALVLQALVAPALARARAPAAEARPVPILPSFDPVPLFARATTGGAV
jgi:membrane-associated phospholipid phosphatase